LLFRIVAALAACVLALPGVATAQSAPVAPGAREVFVVIDAGISTQVINELAPTNAKPSSFGFRAAAELPALGHTFMASFDRTTYNFTHPANNVLPAGITAACPAGDPGCVTPIGFKNYATVASGVALYVPSFNAQDTESHFAVGTKIARDNTRLYLAVGELWRSFNYASAPPQSGFGFGLEKLPDFDRSFSVYGNIWLYTDMHGTFTGPASPILGAFSAYPMTVDYHMFTYRVGATWSFAKSPLFADIGVSGDREDARNANVPADAVHATLSLGVGAHF
jgi:hypothetical protein